MKQKFIHFVFWVLKILIFFLMNEKDRYTAIWSWPYNKDIWVTMAR